MEDTKTIRIGTRESKLAMLQTEMVKRAIEKQKNVQVEILPMKTTGDKILDRTLDQIGGKGLFMKELDLALQEGKSDLSVHSLKDVTMELPEAFPILGVSVREDPRDVLILPKGATQIDFSKSIGCSSKRRVLQFMRLYPDAVCKSIRGNVISRLEKLDRGEYGALILAAAGLIRLGYADRISRFFSTEEILPAAGQGIIAVQGKKGMDLTELNGLSGFFDEDAYYEATAERAYVRFLDGGCSSPIAAHAKTAGEELTLWGLYVEGDRQDYIRMSATGSVKDAEAIGIQLAQKIRKTYREKVSDNR